MTNEKFMREVVPGTPNREYVSNLMDTLKNWDAEQLEGFGVSSDDFDHWTRIITEIETLFANLSDEELGCIMYFVAMVDMVRYNR